MAWRGVACHGSIEFGPRPPKLYSSYGGKRSFRGEDGGSEDSNARTEKVRKVSDVCLEKEADIPTRATSRGGRGMKKRGREVATGGMKARRFLWGRSERGESTRSGREGGEKRQGKREHRYFAVGTDTRMKSRQEGEGRRKKAKWTPRSDEENAGG